jgi:transcription antitermination factor NusG
MDASRNVWQTGTEARSSAAVSWMPPPGSERSEDYPWFAVVIRSSQAELASQGLERLGYEQLLPTRTVRRQWSDRIKVIQEPLFPGYLFCRFDPQNRLPVLMAPGVISIVRSGQTLLPVDGREIETIRSLINSHTPVDPHPYLKAGHRVRIEGGALDGVEGLLLAVRSEYRVIASITILQRSVSVEIDPARLRPI